MYQLLQLFELVEKSKDNQLFKKDKFSKALGELLTHFLC